jgi:hypothetical protein
MAVCDTSAALVQDAPIITMGMVGTLARAYKKLLAKTQPQPAPESEDEAFERAWDKDDQTDSGLKEVARRWWHARARLSAGGK